MGNRAANARMLHEGAEVEHGLLEEGPSQALILLGLINGKASEDHDRDWTICRPALQEADRCVLGLNLPNGQGEEADHLLPIARRYEGTGGIRLLGVAGVSMEPGVERFLAAVEALEAVLAAKRLRPQISHARGLLENVGL